MMSITTITKLALVAAATLTGAASLGARSPAADTAAASYSGDMTYYTAGLGACGVNNGPNDPVAAVNPSAYASGGACGRTATIHYNGKSVTATVRDLCPGCASGDIDVTQSVFEQLAPISAGRVQVTWELN